LERDIERKCDLIVCGDFNESLDEKNGIHKRLREIGLMNVLTLKIGEELPRTYIRGIKCIDHIYVTSKVYHRAEASPFPKNSSQKGRLWTPRRFEYYASSW